MSYVYVRTYTNTDHSLRERIWSHVSAFRTLNDAQRGIQAWVLSEPDHWYAEEQDDDLGLTFHYTIRRIPVE